MEPDSAETEVLDSSQEPSADSEAVEPSESAAAESSAEPEAAPPKLLAQEAYELMTQKLEGFESWDDLTPATRGLFKQRASQMESLPLFEWCAAEILLSRRPQPADE